MPAIPCSMLERYEDQTGSTEPESCLKLLHEPQHRFVFKLLYPFAAD